MVSSTFDKECYAEDCAADCNRIVEAAKVVETGGGAKVIVRAAERDFERTITFEDI